MLVGKAFGKVVCSLTACAVAIGCAAAPAMAAPLEFNRPARAKGSDPAKLEERRQELFQKMLANPGDLDSAFAYAALSSQQGDLEGAIATLERMLIFAPGLPRLQLELGVLYFRLGAYPTARTYFEAALSGSEVPDEVRAKVAQYQASIEAESKGSRLSGVLDTGIRYQSNANNGPNAQLVTLNGLDYVLSKDARGTADLSAFISGEMRGVFDLPAQGAELKIGLSGTSEAFADRHDLNLSYVQVNAGPSFDLNRFGLAGYALDVYGLAAGGVLAGDPLLASLGVGSLLSARPTTDLYLGLRAEYRYEQYYDSDDQPRMSDKSGDRFQLQGVTSYRLSNDVTAGAAFSLERSDAETSWNSYWQYGALVGLTISYASPIGTLTEPWVLDLSTQVSRRRHDQPDAMISLEAQDTTKWSVSATQTIPVTKEWAARLQVSYQRAWSNYDTSAYGNAAVSLGLRKVF